MTTSKELRAWISTLKGWAEAVDNIEVRQQMLELVAKLERLADHEESAERQLI